MAAFSTLQSLQVKSCAQPRASREHGHFFHEDNNETNAAIPTASTPLMLRTAHLPLSANCLFTQHQLEHGSSPDALINTWMDQSFENMPTDGGESAGWFCAHCGDGPYGTWQVSCQKCYRAR